jgi:glycosyltransferase involved in cell wall biosynthesis
MRIAILSDSPFFPTGYSNQAKLLCKYLTDRGHEIHFFANGYQGQNIVNSELEDGTKFPFKIYGQGRQPYFADTISELLRTIKPEAFIILLDTFMLHGDYANPANGWFLKTDTSPAKVFFWYPSDGGAGMPRGCEFILQKVNVPIAMAKFGQKQVKDYYKIETKHIPHGTEPDRFYKLPDEQRDELRKKWNLKDKFVVGVVARNQGRKMLDRTIKAFANVNIDNAILFLHLDPMDPAQIWDIRSIIARYNLENKVRFSGMSALKGFKWSEMNELYNLFDVFFLSTSGEGFGIPIIEAMSCEVPVIATNYTTTPELVIENDSGVAVPLVGEQNWNLSTIDSKIYDDLVKNATLTGSWEVERGLIDVKMAAKAIEMLHESPEDRKRMGENGRKAVLEKYDFMKKVGPAWEKELIG